MLMYTKGREGDFGMEGGREKFDTVGGRIFHLTGRIPLSGEEVATDTIRLTVLEADERKISKVRIARLAEKTEEPGE